MMIDLENRSLSRQWRLGDTIPGSRWNESGFSAVVTVVVVCGIILAVGCIKPQAEEVKDMAIEKLPIVYVRDERILVDSGRGGIQRRPLTFKEGNTVIIKGTYLHPSRENFSNLFVWTISDSTIYENFCSFYGKLPNYEKNETEEYVEVTGALLEGSLKVVSWKSIDNIDTTTIYSACKASLQKNIGRIANEVPDYMPQEWLRKKPNWTEEDFLYASTPGSGKVERGDFVSDPLVPSVMIDFENNKAVCRFMGPSVSGSEYKTYVATAVSSVYDFETSKVERIIVNIWKVYWLE